MSDSNLRTPASTDEPPGTVECETALSATGVHNGQPYIWCRRCGMASYNANDRLHRYCGRFHRFHDEYPPELIERLMLEKPGPGAE